MKDRLSVVIVGTGYVGLTTGLALARLGHSVKCVDKNPKIVDRLKQGILTIFEAGLEELLNELKGDVLFTCDLGKCLEGADVLMICLLYTSRCV